MVQQPIDRPVPRVTSSYAPKAVAQASLAGDLVYPIAPTHHVNVTNNVAMPSIHMSVQARQQPFLLRAIWFLFVGWWLSAIFITVGFALLVLVITIPFGLYILHRVPQAQTLRQRTASFKTEYREGAIHFTEGNQPQYRWYARAVYFLFIGWWFTAVWLYAAWFIGLLVITMPLSVWMIDRTPAVLTLQRR
jgi:uncharacterized membrane protein YccF (DUF307 family)